MPKLEDLELGSYPCETPGGATVKGLTSIAYYCPCLYELCIHFQVASLDPLEIPDPVFVEEYTIPREGCGLTHLYVGEIGVPEESRVMVALTLLNIFPHLERIQSSNSDWDDVDRAIRDSRRLVRCSRPQAMDETGIRSQNIRGF